MECILFYTCTILFYTCIILFYQYIDAIMWQCPVQEIHSWLLKLLKMSSTCVALSRMADRHIFYC